MKRGFALAAIAALIVGISLVSFVPSVRAQVGEMLNVWFRFKTPGGHGEVAISGTADFVPLHPTYLPAEFQTVGFVISDRPGSMELMYHSENQFLSISQSKASADRALPAGQEVMVNSQAAVLVTGLEGTVEHGRRIPEDAYVETVGTPPARPYRGSMAYTEKRLTWYVGDITAEHEDEERRERGGSIAYTDGKRLTWYVGDIKVEMLSNLSAEELLKVAESLVPAEAGEGEPPFGPLRDLLSGGDQKVIEVEGGCVTIIRGDSAESDQ